MYHCHVFSHMQAGMSGMMMVVDGDDTLPDVGAVFALSDEPGLPIQTPTSPDDKWVVSAHVLGPKITAIDTSSDKIVKTLNCDPGCHGVQWGAKDDGGYYAYVSNKFSNALLVVDPDPNNDGDGSDAEIVGKILLNKQFDTDDDSVIAYAGMGGQGVLAIPNVYNGWIDATVLEYGNSPDPCSQEIIQFLSDLTPDQKQAKSKFDPVVVAGSKSEVDPES